MRTARFLSFLPGIRKMSNEVERLREEAERHRELLRSLRDERRILKGELSESRKLQTKTWLELQTESSYARRALDELLEAAGGDASFLEGAVSAELDVADDMLWKTTAGAYFRTGLDAVSLMHRYLERQGRDPSSIGSLLDLPSGFGRVTRFLRAWRPDARLQVCDLQENGARYCVEKFGAELVTASVTPEDIVLESPVDLIWCGSLVTHLNADLFHRFVKRFSEFLNPDGLLFFSSHGDGAAARLISGATNYGLADEAVVGIVEDWKREGFGYRDYPRIENYGISLASREWIEGRVATLAGLEMVDFLPLEWVQHHDVIVCRKTGAGA